jgi:hypothetical protein
MNRDSENIDAKSAQIEKSAAALTMQLFND